jgi:hypothetical protein
MILFMIIVAAILFSRIVWQARAILVLAVLLYWLFTNQAFINWLANPFGASFLILGIVLVSGFVVLARVYK